MDNQEQEKRNFRKMFNMNSILAQVINFAAYIILLISVFALIYISFVQKFNIKIDWVTLTLFSIATVALCWLNWNTWYRKQYEKLMSEDIAEHSKGKYSIHARYYHCIKDWSDIELQKKIDQFNDEYTAKWLRWVEKTTGVLIETREEVELDAKGQPVLDENGKPKIIIVKGIKDLPYKHFKYKRLMWRIKNHKYPQSGYKTSMELMSLFSFQDANLNKRNLKADKQYYAFQSSSKFLSSLLTITMGASLVPEMISGNYAAAILKLILGLGSLLTSVLMGAMNGFKGGRLKLSVVEDACTDVERWGNMKPVVAPYEPFKTQFEEVQPTQEVQQNTEKPAESQPVITKEIFNFRLPK